MLFHSAGILYTLFECTASEPVHLEHQYSNFSYEGITWGDSSTGHKLIHPLLWMGHMIFFQHFLIKLYIGRRNKLWNLYENVKIYIYRLYTCSNTCIQFAFHLWNIVPLLACVLCKIVIIAFITCGGQVFWSDIISTMVNNFRRQMNNAQISWMEKGKEENWQKLVSSSSFFFEKRRQFLLHFSANDLLCAQVVNARFLFHYTISLSFFIFTPTNMIPP